MNDYSISRRGALNAMCDNCDEMQPSTGVCTHFPCTRYVAIRELKAAQPEIIHCKDCKWWDKSEDSPFGYCMAAKHGYMSPHWEIGIYRRYKGDFYCADAERRE